ncbi:hypothetical protein OG689_44205 [Kitasatospora sp. NBC_00240]|uniref:hypothetical protein n=1 Tax=Kitasatospora sp. NBC_00240 TaxID=2903567 RepID=UPI002257949E|nr:hypothetical protein [Kitasatospora sp. NBC_00240]MCX5216141.1 hypothetical protein [Kitasatospora sp. NBC_00240]
MSITVTLTADPTNPAKVATAATAAITETVQAAAERYSAPTGRLREASWRSGRLDAGDLLARLADLPDPTPVMVDDELLTAAGYDGTVRLHTARTAPPAPGAELRPATPASVWRSARTALLTVGQLRVHLADVPDFAPVTVDGDALEDADYGGALQLYTPYTGTPDEDEDEDDEDDDC